MREILNRNRYLLRQTAGFFHANQDADVFDLETGERILQCREIRPARIVRLLRYTDFKRTTPFDIRVYTLDGQPIVRVRRGIPLVVNRIAVLDETDCSIGSFRLRAFSISGHFDVLDATDQPVCSLRGNLTGLNFRFVTPEGDDLAIVKRKWDGIGKELFSDAAAFTLTIDDAVPPDSTVRQLILASVLCIGIALKVET